MVADDDDDVVVKLPDHFDKAIVGEARRCGESFLVYDEEKVL